MIAVIVCLLQLRQVFRTATGIFGSGKASAFGTQHFPIDRIHSRFGVAPFRHGNICHRLLGLTQLHVAMLSLCQSIRSIRPGGDVVQAIHHHHVRHVQHVFGGKRQHRVAERIGQYIILEVELHQRVALLLVLSDGYHRFGKIIYRIINTFGRLGRKLNRRKQLLDFRFDAVYIHITYHHDSLQVGAIPFLVIIAQNLIREMVDNRHQSDRRTAAIPAIRENNR